MPNEGYLDKSVHWKVRSGRIGFAEPTHREVADAIRDCGLALEGCGKSKADVGRSSSVGCAKR